MGRRDLHGQKRWNADQADPNINVVGQDGKGLEGRLRRASSRTVDEMWRERERDAGRDGERDMSFALRSTCYPVMHPAGGEIQPDVWEETEGKG